MVADQIRAVYWRRSWLSVMAKGAFKTADSLQRATGCHLITKNTAWETLTHSDLHVIDRWINDYLRTRSSFARGLLGKMRAEADMCSYLAASFFLLPIVQLALAVLFQLSNHATALKHLWTTNNYLWHAASWATTALLCISVAYRTKRMVLRMISMLSVATIQPKSMNETEQSQFSYDTIAKTSPATLDRPTRRSLL